MWRRSESDSATNRVPRVAVPKVTETFIVREIHAALDVDLEVDVYCRCTSTRTSCKRRLRLSWTGSRGGAGSRLDRGDAVLTWLGPRPARTIGLFVPPCSAIRDRRGSGARPVTVPVAMVFAGRHGRDGVQYVHAHWATHPALAAWVIHQLTGIPYSVTVHAHDLYVERPMIERKLPRCERNRDDLGVQQAHAFGHRPGPWPTGFMSSAAESELPEPVPEQERDRRLVVCVGSLQDYKGQQYLIEAAAFLQRDGRELAVVLVGDGELRSMLERKVNRAGLTSVVRFLGHQPTERVGELLGDATVVVQPSVVTPEGKMEGIPVALMEAMSTGAAVVATDISGISELVEDAVTGLLVPERDPAALAKAIAELLDDPELRRRLGRAARKRVEDDYELGRNAALLLPLLTSTSRIL